MMCDIIRKHCQAYLDKSVDFKYSTKKKIIFQTINKEKGLSPRAQMQIPAF